MGYGRLLRSANACLRSAPQSPHLGDLPLSMLSRRNRQSGQTEIICDWQTGHRSGVSVRVPALMSWSLRLKSQVEDEQIACGGIVPSAWREMLLQHDLR